MAAAVLADKGVSFILTNTSFAFRASRAFRDSFLGGIPFVSRSSSTALGALKAVAADGREEEEEEE